jgi:hypothetical protein
MLEMRRALSARTEHRVFEEIMRKQQRRLRRQSVALQSGAEGP